MRLEEEKGRLQEENRGKPSISTEEIDYMKRELEESRRAVDVARRDVESARREADGLREDLRREKEF